MTGAMIRAWQLTLTMPPDTGEADMGIVEGEIEEAEQREPLLPFIWRRRGPVFVVRTANNPFLLTQIAVRVLENTFAPSTFTVEQGGFPPLEPGEGWRGHGRP